MWNIRVRLDQIWTLNLILVISAADQPESSIVLSGNCLLWENKHQFRLLFGRTFFFSFQVTKTKIPKVTQTRNLIKIRFSLKNFTVTSLTSCSEDEDECPLHTSSSCVVISCSCRNQADSSVHVFCSLLWLIQSQTHWSVWVKSVFGSRRSQRWWALLLTGMSVRWWQSWLSHSARQTAHLLFISSVCFTFFISDKKGGHSGVSSKCVISSFTSLWNK